MINAARAIARRPLARGAAVRLVRVRARLAPPAPPPRVLVVSLPKAGTHLVTGLLQRLPKMLSSGCHLAPGSVVRGYLLGPPPQRGPLFEPDLVDWGAVRALLGRARPGQFVSAHFPPSPELSRILEELGYRTVFVYRDPRDVVVSQVAYIKDRRSHPMHNRLMNTLETDEKRLLAVINGLPGSENERGLPPLRVLLEAFLPWRDTADTFPCRYEDLIGVRGGGSAEQEVASVTAIAEHVGRPVDPQAAVRLAAEDRSATSATFRRGAIGDWRSHFRPSHVEAFRGALAAMLVEYGYEDDEGWLEEEARPLPLAEPARGTAR